MNNFRNDVLSWDSYFMLTALTIATRSKDPKTQVGSCIVDNNHQILSLGYNGMPVGIKDNDENWNDETKHNLVIHSEANAILHCKHSVNNSTLYVTLFPCNECAKLIITSGIKKVVYLKIKDSKNILTNISMKMFDEAGVIYEKYKEVNKEFIFKM